MITSAAQLLAAAARKRQAVTVRGAELTITELSITARDAFLAAVKEGPRKAAAVVIAHGVIDPNTGAPVMTGEEADALGEASADFVQELVSLILQLSGLGSSGNE